MPNRSVLGVRVVGFDRTHHNLAGIHADTDLQIDSLFGPEALCVPPDACLHPKRCVECTLGVILVRNRCPKQREDAIPVDCAT